MKITKYIIGLGIMAGTVIIPNPMIYFVIFIIVFY